VTVTRLDPTHSRMFSWLEFDDSDAENPVLRARYRTNGAEWEYWPVTEDEAKRVMNPGKEYEFSIGRAFGDLIKSRKNARPLSKGAVKSPEKTERRWLA